MVGVVPCAGRSVRMGRSKALLDAAGEPFVVRVVQALQEGGCDPVLVAVRDLAGPEAAAARGAGARVVENPDPSPGPISSLRAALEALDPPPDGLVFLPVDHPRVRPETVAALIREAASTGAPVVVPRTPGPEGRRGHPVLFGGQVLPELLDPALEGGARTVVRRDPRRVREVVVDDPGILQDLDTPGDYARAFGSPLPAQPEGASGESGTRHRDGDDAAPGSGLTAAGAARAIVGAVEAGDPAVAVTRLGAVPRRRVLVFRGSGAPEALGTLGDPVLDDAADRLARELLRGQRQEGRATAGEDELYLEAHHPTPELVIVGAGHIARPLSSLGAVLGFRVTVADDRPEFADAARFPDAHRVVRVDFGDPFAEVEVGPLTHVVLVTRGHKYDYECLRRLLLSDARPRYVGMIGSRRRVRATFEQLVAEGISPERLAAVRAPVGLDLGAETPGEIAVAVAAEMVMEWRGGTGTPLHRVERVVERFFGGGEG